LSDVTTFRCTTWFPVAVSMVVYVAPFRRQGTIPALEVHLAPSIVVHPVDLDGQPLQANPPWRWCPEKRHPWLDFQDVTRVDHLPLVGLDGIGGRLAGQSEPSRNWIALGGFLVGRTLPTFRVMIVSPLLTAQLVVPDCRSHRRNHFSRAGNEARLELPASTRKKPPRLWKDDASPGRKFLPSIPLTRHRPVRFPGSIGADDDILASVRPALREHMEKSEPS